MPIRWPFVRRSTFDRLMENHSKRIVCDTDEYFRLKADIAAKAETIDDQADEIRDCHEHVATVEAERDRLKGHLDFLAGAFGQVLGVDAPATAAPDATIVISPTLEGVAASAR